MTPEQEEKILIGIQWKVNPPICVGCQCPMFEWERNKIKELKEPAIGIFMFQMIDKYGEEVKQWFPKEVVNL